MGIDYGMGRSNIDRDTGIRYGIIHSHALGEFSLDEFEAEYSSGCPKCGEELSDEQRDAVDPSGPCPHCEETIRSDETWGDEPIAHVLDSQGYKGFMDEQGDVWLTASPFYCYGSFCSPCAPGACMTDAASTGTGPEDEKGDARAFCFAPDWYREGEGPRATFRVKDESRLAEGEE